MEAFSMGAGGVPAFTEFFALPGVPDIVTDRISSSEGAPFDRHTDSFGWGAWFLW
jgi:hypothetical protein